LPTTPRHQHVGIAPSARVTFLVVEDQVGCHINIGDRREEVIKGLAQPDKGCGMVVRITHGSAVLVGIPGVEDSSREGLGEPWHHLWFPLL
jgi:hypothetical protein